MQRSKTCSQFLTDVNPDIVERLNQEIRNEKEIERKRKEEDKKKEDGTIVENLGNGTGQGSKSQTMVTLSVTLL